MAATLDTSPAHRPVEVTCPMCRHRYDPEQNISCQGCPLNAGCHLSCCPACGYSSPDPSQSGLVRALGKLRRR